MIAAIKINSIESSGNSESIEKAVEPKTRKLFKF